MAGTTCDLFTTSPSINRPRQPWCPSALVYGPNQFGHDPASGLLGWQRHRLGAALEPRSLKVREDLGLWRALVGRSTMNS